MTGIKSFIVPFATTAVVATNYILLNAQVASPPSRSASITVSVVMQNSRLSVGQEAKTILTMMNIGNHVVIETGDPSNYRLHIEGEAGEPPKTLWHRRLLGEPGLAPLEVTVPAFPRDILPGRSVDRTFLLSAFYVLSTPGKYKAYLDVRDESDVWLRTNITTFEILAPSQNSRL